MISFDEALKKARELKSNIDYCIEYNDAWLFGCRDEFHVIGATPVIVLKENGKAIDAVTYYDNYDAEELGEIDI